MKYIVSLEGDKIMPQYMGIIDSINKETLAKVITLANKMYNLKFNEFTEGRYGTFVSLSEYFYGAYLSIVEVPTLEELVD